VGNQAVAGILTGLAVQRQTDPGTTTIERPETANEGAGPSGGQSPGASAPPAASPPVDSQPPAANGDSPQAAAPGPATAQDSPGASAPPAASPPVGAQPPASNGDSPQAAAPGPATAQDSPGAAPAPSPDGNGPGPAAGALSGELASVWAAFQSSVEAMKASLVAGAAAKREAILTAAENQKSLSRAGVEAQAARVDKSYDDAIAGIATALDQARSTVTAEREAQVALVKDKAAADLDLAGQAVLEKKEALDSAASTRAQTAKDFGESEAQRATGTSRTQAVNAVDVGEAKAREWGNSERWELIARTAHDMASELAKTITATGDKAADQARKDGGELAAKFPAEATKTAKDFDQAGSEGKDSIKHTRDKAIDDITAMTQEPITHLETQAQDLTAKLQAQQTDARQQMLASADAADRGIDQAAQQAAAKLDSEATDATTELDTSVQQLSAGVSTSKPAAAKKILAQAEGDIAVAAAKFDTDTGTLVTSATQAFATGASEVVTKTTTQADQLIAPVADVAGQFTTTAEQTASDLTAKMRDSAGQATTDMDGVVTAVAGQLQQALDNAQAQWDDDLTKGKGEISAKVDKALAENAKEVSELGAKIDAKAKDIDTESWLSRVTSFIGGMFTGLFKGLVELVVVLLIVAIAVVIILAVVLLIAAAIGGLAGVIAVLAFLGAAAEILGPIVAVILVIAAVAMVIYGAYKIYQALTRGDLTDFERGELFGSGTFDIVTVLFGEEIVKGLAKWLEGLRGAEEGAELAEIAKLVGGDENLARRLLALTDGNAEELKGLLGLVDNNGTILEKLLLLTGKDTAKLRELLGACGKGEQGAIRLEQLLRDANGDADKLLQLIRDNGGDLTKVEEALAQAKAIDELAAKVGRAEAERLVQELSADKAKALVEQLGPDRVKNLLGDLTPTEIQEFVDRLGAPKVQDLADKFGGDAMKSYGVDFFEKYEGVTQDTMNHLLTNDGISGGEIKGCHDRATFMTEIAANGQVLSQTPHPSDPTVVKIEYKLYMRQSGAVKQPPTFGPGQPKLKTVIDGLAADTAKWQAMGDEAADSAIKAKTFPKTGGYFKGITSGGLEIGGYYNAPGIATFFPIF
jgi:hypothetical protein